MKTAKQIRQEAEGRPVETKAILLYEALEIIEFLEGELKRAKRDEREALAVIGAIRRTIEDF